MKIKGFFDYWVKGFDPESESGAKFSKILDKIRDPGFDITSPADTKLVELDAYVDLTAQLADVKKYEPRSYTARTDQRQEIERLEGLLDRWRFNYVSRYSEDFPLPTPN